MKTIYKFLLPGVALALAMPTLAATPQLKVPARGEQTFKTRGAAKAAKTPMSVFSGRKAPAKTAGWGGALITEAEKYGTLREVFSEDFSLMADGTEENPAIYTDMTIDPNAPNYEYPWWNMDPKYSHQPHWGTGNEGEGSASCPAGGCFYMKATTNASQTALYSAHINTPNIDVSQDGGTCVLEFRARTSDTENTYDWLFIEAAETNNMGPTWRTIDDPIRVTGVTNEWTTYRILFRAGGPTTIFNLVCQGPGDVYIDDLKVYQVVPFVDQPQDVAHSEYLGSSFVLNWTPVKDADKYIVNVWQEETNSFTGETTRTDIVTGREVTEPTTKIENAQSGDIYYCNVIACKGDKQSVESTTYRVYDLETPVMLDPVLKEGQGNYYIAQWETVPAGDVYNYYAYAKRVAEADGEFVVTDEDFTGLRDADGNMNGLTKENCGNDDELDFYTTYYPNETKQQGWYAPCTFPFDDYLAISAFWWMWNGEQGGYISPEFDMSADGGKFTVNVDLAGLTKSVWMGDDKYEDRTTQAIVALFTYDEAVGDFVQTEWFNTLDLKNPVNFDFQTYTFNFTKGTNRSVIGVFADYSPSVLFVDNLKITQNRKAGDEFMDPFRYKHWHGAKETEENDAIEITVPTQHLGCEIYHKVSAFGMKPDKYQQFYEERESAFTPLSFVMKSDFTAVDCINNESVLGNAYVSGSNIVVLNPAGEEVAIYTTDGKVLYQGNAAMRTLTPGQTGVYVVTIGGKTFKLAL